MGLELPEVLFALRTVPAKDVPKPGVPPSALKHLSDDAKKEKDVDVEPLEECPDGGALHRWLSPVRLGLQHEVHAARVVHLDAVGVEILQHQAEGRWGNERCDHCTAADGLAPRGF